MDHELSKLFESLSVADIAEIDETVDFLKFGKFIFNNNKRIKFINTSCLLEELKVNGIDTDLPNELIKGFYDKDEVMRLCRKNDLEHILNICTKAALDHILMEVEFRYYKLVCVKSVITDIINCLEMFEVEKSFIQSDFSVHIVYFVESLLKVLDKNYTKGLNRERVSVFFLGLFFNFRIFFRFGLIPLSEIPC